MTAQRLFVFLGFILSVTFFLVVSATSSWAGVNCGDTIGPNQVAVPTNDLTCNAGNTSGNTALILIGPNAVLKLGGHTVICDGVDVGIQLNGAGAILTGGLLKHGTVTGCENRVVVGGDGHHRVAKVTARNNTNHGFEIESDDNELHNNRAIANTSHGFNNEAIGPTSRGISA
jgi:hypothetical protein